MLLSDDPSCLTMELVSPVLCGKDGLGQVEVVMGVLSELKVKVNESTGFHVHIGSNPFFSLEEVLKDCGFLLLRTFLTLRFKLKRICANFVKYEDAFDSLVPVSRRGVNNKYCRSHLQTFGLQPNRVDSLLSPPFFYVYFVLLDDQRVHIKCAGFENSTPLDERWRRSVL